MEGTMWTGRELERLVAAKMAEVGIVPLLRPRDPDTKAEIDVYAVAFGSDSVRKALIECKSARPSSQEIEAINGLLPGYDGDEAVFITARQPHDDQVNLARTIGVTLISTDANSHLTLGHILDTEVDFGSPLDPVGRAVVTAHRCISALHCRAQVAAKKGIVEAQKVVHTFDRVVSSILRKDPMARASDLYELHFANQRLPQECAVAEELGPTPEKALQAAYAHNAGTYTQSALMTQTLNRCFTIAAIAETACSHTTHNTLPDRWLTTSVSPRAQAIRQWLSAQEFREFVAPLMFYLVFAFGGFWPVPQEEAVFAEMHRLTGAPLSAIPDIIKLINDIFKREEGDAIQRVDWRGVQWKNLILCPYPLKGVGCRLMNELGLPLASLPYSRWHDALSDVERECEEYERKH